jgi:hypothetical protein
MLESPTFENPVFTEAEVDMCLANAANLRSSFLARDLSYIPEEERFLNEAKMFDDLAIKIARLAKLEEVEQVCAFCDTDDQSDALCRSCLGTKIWPPTDKEGNRVYPKLNAMTISVELRT